MTDPLMQEIARQPAEATLTETEDGRWRLVMSRDLAHPPERVWPKLVDPAQLATWSPFVPDRVLDSAGPARAREKPEDEWLEAEVLVVDPPRELVHRWGDDLMRWTLTPTATGCRLTMEHTVDEGEGTPMYAAGWHICLAVLVTEPGARVTGERAREFGWTDLEAAYRKALIR